MQAVKARNTSLEKKVSTALHRRRLRYRRCLSSLPGKPDFVFVRAKVVVFVDGDFWHGWRFPKWKDKLTDYWRKKLSGTAGATCAIISAFAGTAGWFFGSGVIKSSAI